MIDYEKQLNEEQKKAVLNGDGACLVLAGAGSGKTRVITYRTAYLLEQGVNSENILLVTFTNKAAGEMVKRVQELTGNNNRLPWAGTFHHIANKILRVYAPYLSFDGEKFFKNNFSVLDSDDSNSLLKICSKPYRKVNSTQRFPSASVLRSIISFARNSDITIEDVLEMKYPHAIHFAEDIKNVFLDYEKRKKQANAMDFDDLLLNLLRLLQDENVRNKFSTQFKYVLVDEYQDTNKIQAKIIDLFASVHKNIFVVGDDAQSIYSFRAADISNILDFEKKYKNTKIFKLETNYRSTQKILDLANNVIENNPKQYKKSLKTLLKGDISPELRPAIDQFKEATMVAKKIEEMIDGGTDPKEIAVLFRASHHSQMLEMELVKRGISYDYRGGVRFFDRAHVKDVLSYLRIINNLADSPAWIRVLTKEEGIGLMGAQKVIDNLKDIDSIEDVKGIGWKVLGQKAKNGWNKFVNIFEKLLGIKKEPAELINVVIESGYKDYLKGEYADAKERTSDLLQLVEFAKKYDDLESFLAEASLQEGFRGQSLGNNQNYNEPKIVLSTIHQAKGLEWEKVFVLNLSNGGFPNDRAMREPRGIEEERRLFYVAITRAKNMLCLTYPMAGGVAGGLMSGPSLFLSEISEGLLDDHSFLTTDNFTVYNDEKEDITYVPDNSQITNSISFLKNIDDL